MPDIHKLLEEARSGLCAYTGGADGACGDTIAKIDAAPAAEPAALEREAFEKWAEGKGYLDFERDCDAYVDETLSQRWMGWKGARSLSAPAEGWKMVPVEPTREMVDAAYTAHDAYETAAAPAAWCGLASAYAAMLTAAPQPPASPSAPVGGRTKLAQQIRMVVRAREAHSSTVEFDNTMARAIADALDAPAEETFQARVQPWMMACFGAEISADRLERGDRLLEEVLELLQSGDYPRERIAALTEYVWSRPAGEPHQEVGGVKVTLAAYCLAHGLDMHEAGEAELARIWTKVEQIRAKQAAKPTGSALPVAVPAPTTEAVSAEVCPHCQGEEVVKTKHTFGKGWEHEACPVCAGGGNRPLITREWLERKVALEEGVEVGVGLRTPVSAEAVKPLDDIPGFAREVVARAYENEGAQAAADAVRRQAPHCGAVTAWAEAGVRAAIDALVTVPILTGQQEGVAKGSAALEADLAAILQAEEAPRHG